MIQTLTLIVLLGLACGQVFLWLFVMRQQRERAHAAATSAATAQHLAQNVRDWIAEMRQVASDSTHDLDQRIARATTLLDQLEHDAPQKAAPPTPATPRRTTRKASPNKPISTETDSPTALNDQRARVAALAAEGIARSDIARATGLNLAEVDLCLSLLSDQAVAS